MNMADAPTLPADGVRALPPREEMDETARKVRDTYLVTPGAPLLHREFGYYCLEEWREQGLPEGLKGEAWNAYFSYDPHGIHWLGGCGGCEAALVPEFEVEVIEDRGEHEVVRDAVGRKVLCFKGRRSGFMPDYLDHPVKDRKTWEEEILWRMDPDSPERYADLDARMARARADAARGLMLMQRVVGGYMYLRSLIGPEDLLYAFYDMPELIHECMKAWLRLADGVIARHQEHVTLDVLALDEDICYNHGPLISPDMIREFLFPYYQQLADNVRARQIDRSRRLFFQLDTDGYLDPVIPLYREGVGLDVLAPFEVAAGNDVIRAGQEYPDLVILGGIDKRELAKGKDAIDRMVERILPAMRERGGYVPTCDHGVPAEVRLEDYLHYRKRCVELGG